ncbi:MAG: carboxymuconolactone decarboxylase family protein [Acetobacteraceae bacterium]
MAPERLRQLSAEEMTEEQRAVMDEIHAGPRKGSRGPFKAMIRSPGLMRHAQKMGAHVRFDSTIPPRLNELAILMTARHWTAQFEWYAHNILAMEAGLDPAVAAAIQVGQRPAAMQADEAEIYAFCKPLLEYGSVPDAAYAAVLARFGERGVIDLVGVIGYYSFVSMVLNVDRTPLPEGEQTPLQPLK